MSVVTVMMINFSAVLTLMVIGWLISLVYRNVTIADSLWGLGFVLIAWITFFLGDGFYLRKLLIALLVSFWGIRLSLYLTLRNWGQGEDHRYGSWREKSGDRFWLVSLFKVFILQAIFLWVIALAPQWGQLSDLPAKLSILDYLGFTLWLTGFLFESISDQQLYRFKMNPSKKGQVMDTGLWAYSRHPNYFGECIIWWGLFLITLATPRSGWTIVSPIIITLVLLKMTGVPMMEKTIVKTRPGYADYIKRTSSFFPWFPQKKADR